MEFSKTYKLGNTNIDISTGKIAKQAQGSVLLKMGGTALLASVTMEKKNAEADFFPLSVEYIEKMYARGAISGSRFQKREGLPSEEAIIKARQVDHSIRSLFPKSFKRATSLVLTVLSYDQENDPEILAVFGASLALSLTGAPFMGPCSGVVAGFSHDDKVVLNPLVEGREDLKAEFLITGVDDRALSIEGWAKELTDEQMDMVLDESMALVKEMNAAQTDFINGYKNAGGEINVMQTEEGFSDLPAPEDLINKIKETKYDAIKESLFQPEKADRNVFINKIKEELATEHITAESSVTEMDISNAIEYIARRIIRDSILKEDKRRLGRNLTEIRPISVEVDVLPTVHGSAIFNRGLTQSLSIATLGPIGNAQMVDAMEGESTKRFMHHYNMPPYASGEAGRFPYHPGRREIGHGAIGENALKHMIPTEEEFPYTIRVVSEIMSSNGSTSMAATCASSMALMIAGVPMKKAVAGIGVGLVTEDRNEDNYKLMLDIEGIEDFYGDMDFKVTGTDAGITAIQYENKLRGVKLSVLKEAFRLANNGRQQVLKIMNEAIATPRASLPSNAPIVEKMEIDKERIGELIGPGGKNIKEIVAKASALGKNPVDINIDDNGIVTISASNGEQLKFVKDTINNNFAEAEIGAEYIGKVDKVMPYGVFVDVSGSISGLLHVSEMWAERTNADLEKIFSEGQEVKVKVIGKENGKTSFSIKGIEQQPELQDKLSHPENFPAPEFRRDDRRDDRGGYGRRDDRGDRRFGNRPSRFR
jgi:polyribonucleotide nucleotidyltransferase